MWHSADRCGFGRVGVAEGRQQGPDGLLLLQQRPLHELPGRVGPVGVREGEDPVAVPHGGPPEHGLGGQRGHTAHGPHQIGQWGTHVDVEPAAVSFVDLGPELFGGRDHTTVLHAVRKIADERAHDSQLNHEIHVIEQTLKA